MRLCQPACVKCYILCVYTLSMYANWTHTSACLVASCHFVSRKSVSAVAYLRSLHVTWGQYTLEAETENVNVIETTVEKS